MNPPPPMKSAFTPPWDQPAWAIIDLKALFANLDKLEPIGQIIDLRSSLMSVLAPHILPDLKRRGLSGFFTNTITKPMENREFLEGWTGFLLPPFNSGRLIYATRLGFIPVLGQIPEAIYVSNDAQSVNRSAGIFLRIRSDDLLADQGPNSLLSLLETIPTLPRLELAGFYCDQPFSTRQKCDSFSRALNRTHPHARGLKMISRTTGAHLPKLECSTQIGTEIFGLDTAGTMNSTLSIQAWGVPMISEERKLLLMIDLGTMQGLPDEPGKPVTVENIPGILIRTEEWRALIEIPERPARPSPWVVTLSPSTTALEAEKGAWSKKDLEQLAFRLAPNLPLYLRHGADAAPFWVNTQA